MPNIQQMNVLNGRNYFKIIFEWYPLSKKSSRRASSLERCQRRRGRTVEGVHFRPTSIKYSKPSQDVLGFEISINNYSAKLRQNSANNYSFKIKKFRQTPIIISSKFHQFWRMYHQFVNIQELFDEFQQNLPNSRATFDKTET